MIGTAPTIKDIILEEAPPCPISLHCNEQIEEEIELEIEAEPQPALQPYRVDVPCGHCDRPLKLVILSDASGVRTLQSLLFENLSLVCGACSTRRYIYY
nr:E7 protein [Felis domesticus papillomavirus 2]